MEKNIPCDLCGGVVTAPYLGLVRHSPFALVKCLSCGLVFLDPRPDPSEIKSYYSPFYYTSCPPEPADNGMRNRLKKLAYAGRCSDPTQWHRTAKIVMPIARSLIGWRAYRRVPPRTKGNLLDVGCGTGEQAAWLRDNLLNWEVEGVEINSHAAQIAESLFNLKVYQGHLPDLNLPPEKYDMVSFWHSLEHTYSPNATLKETFRLLRRGGWVGIEVPNICSWEARQTKEHWYHLAIPVHLYHFSVITLSALLKQNGFTPISVEKVRGRAGLDNWIEHNRANYSWTQRIAVKAGVQTLGRFSPWGIRIYAAKV